MPLKIEKWLEPNEQMATLGNNHWSVARLFELSKNLPVMEVPLVHLNINNVYPELRLRDMVSHIQAVLDADLDMPIILDEDGDIMDGRHRIMKALLTQAETIKAVRFEKNPIPDRVDPS